MSYTKEQLKVILGKTRRKCHLCHRRLALRAYGITWHVDHSRPLARGGTNHLNNLYAACISCNCSKQHGSNAVARAANGKRRAPLSHVKYSEEVTGNTILGGCAGAFGGAWLLGPAGFWVGLAVGALVGSNAKVDK